MRFIQKGQVRSARDRRACMIRCTNVDEAGGICKDRSRWRFVVSAYPHGKKAWVYVMYVCYACQDTIPWRFEGQFSLEPFLL